MKNVSLFTHKLYYRFTTILNETSSFSGENSGKQYKFEVKEERNSPQVSTFFFAKLSLVPLRAFQSIMSALTGKVD